MIPLDTALAFFGLAVSLAAAPGPDNLYVLSQSAVHGFRAGFVVTLGLATGLIGHTVALALGLALLIARTPLLFVLLQIAGAGYLVYLGISALRAGASAASTVPPATRQLTDLYRRGIFMNLSNPKVSLFFLALLPQFTDPARGAPVAQLIVLGALFITATLLVFGTVALTAVPLGRWLRRRPGAELMLTRITGIMLLALAAYLLMSAGLEIAGVTKP